MADELRWETLFVNSGGSGSPQEFPAAAEFRNDSSKKMFIRKIFEAFSLTNVNNDEGADIELSKAPTAQMSVNNGVFFVLPVRLVQNGGEVNVTDKSRAMHNGRIAFAKGELTLEPNESLFVNVQQLIDDNGASNATYVIGYHY